MKLIKNIFVYLFLLFENGKVFVFMFILFLIYKMKFTGVRIQALTSKNKPFLLLTILLFTIYFLLSVFTNSALGTRYYMPVFFMFTVLLFLFSYKLNIKKIYTYSLILTGILLAGNFFIYFYPEKTAKSWDTTLGHLPFYELRDECFNYLETNNIPYEDVSSGFCIFGNQTYIDLKPEYRYICDADDSKRTYILYSNIFNWDDKLIDEVKDTRKWSLVKDFKKGAVFITLYKKAE